MTMSRGAQRQLQSLPAPEQDHLPERFHALDGLRGLAALVVFLYHTQWLSGLALPHAFVAVDLFFVISGVVLASRYLDPLQSGRLSVRAFLALRLLRLYPAALFGMLLGAVAVIVPVLFHHRSATVMLEYAAAVLAGLLLLPVPVPEDDAYLYILNPAMWSLLMELCMNMVIAALLPAVLRWTRSVLLCSALLWLACAAMRTGFEVGPLHQATSLIGGVARTAYGLILGGVLYWQRRRLAALASTGAATALASTAFLSMCLAPRLESGVHAWSADFQFDALAALLIAPLIVAGCLSSGTGRWTFLQDFLGRLSYPFYVVHMPMVRMVLSAHIAERTGSGQLATLLALLLSLALATLVARYYEPLARGWLTHLGSLRA